MADGFADLGECTVAEHIDKIERQIRAKPQDAGLRLALCHFLSVCGAWSRADDQLKAAVKHDPTFAGASATCAMALRGERAREAFWAGGEPPTVLGEAAPWVQDLITAAALPAERASEAAALRESARDAAPARAGRLICVARGATRPLSDREVEAEQQADFEWLCDGDARLGSVLEVFGAAGYGWLVLPSVRHIKLRRPEHLVDLLWMPIEVEMQDGKSMALLTPVRYPADLATQEEALLLSRRTDWEPLGGDEQYAGQGQRTFIGSDDDHPLLELRRIEFAAAQGDS